MDIIAEDRERYRKIFAERDRQKDHWVYNTCGLCYAECAIKVRVVNGKPVAIEGVPESDRGPQGGLCARGVAGLMDLYSPNRILYPVKRTNPKKGLHEDPKWQRISWEEALDTITEKLSEARKKNPKSVFFGFTPIPTGGMRANISFMRFQMAFGSNSSGSGGPGVMCGAAAHHLGALQFASWDVLPDYRFCNYVLRCGGSEGWGGGRLSGTSIRMAAAARERGMRMKVMDPQGYTVATKGDEWIPLLPATDSAVFLAMANLIVNEIGVYDKEFIRHKTNGAYLVGTDRLFVRDDKSQKPLLYDETDGKVKTYDDPGLIHPAIEGKYIVQNVESQPAFALIKEHIKQYKPEWAAEISTVPVNTIRQLAKELVESARIGDFIDIGGVKVPYRPACVVGYRGIQTHQNSFHQYASMHMLNILLGNLDTCGGILGSGTVRSLGYPETGEWNFTPYAGYDGMLTAGMWMFTPPWPPHKISGPGTAANFNDLFTHNGGSFYPYGEDWEELWTNAGRPFEPAAFFIYGTNPVMNCVRQEAAANWLKKLPFCFSLQPFHSETTEGFCDIVLPESHYLETLDMCTGFGIMYNHPIGLDKFSIHIRMPAIEPQGESRNIQDVMNDLADKLGIRSAYNAYLNDYYTFKMSRQGQGKTEEINIINPEEKVSNSELIDKTLKYHFGKEHGLEHFMDHGCITWDKRPEECYWRSFVKARIPIYFESLEADREELKSRGEKIGFDINWNQYTGTVSYFPSIIYTELPPDSEYDLFLVSPHDSLHTGRFTTDNPYINELSSFNPFTYNIAMNVATARRKGIQDGDFITLENHWGDKVTGSVKLTQLIHPKVVSALGLGAWAKGATIGRGKGINPNDLIRSDRYHMCPIVNSSEPTVRIKAYKNER